MTRLVVIVFGVVYLGMFLGRLPRLRLDRTGVALLGAIALVATETVSAEDAVKSIDLPTLTLLFAFMVLSAQLRLGGFYTRVIEGVTNLRLPPLRMLGAVILATGLLSAVFTNDIVCLAAAPVLIHACWRQHLHPVPFLLALACAANIGSAATLIGNPQNILIGQVLNLSFAGYLLHAAGPALLGLGVVWGVIAWQYRGRWHHEPPRREPAAEAPPPWSLWQASKGLAMTAFLFLAFLFTDWPRDMLALGAAGVLLCSRRMHSRDMLGLVDWELLVLFCGLFVVNHAFQETGLPQETVVWLEQRGMALDHPAWMYGCTVLLSNAVSNVPAIMLLLPFAHHPLAGPVLALSSTLAGNVSIVGSIANLIVVDAAMQHGIVIDWRVHARTGLPVSLLTLAIAGAWLSLG